MQNMYLVCQSPFYYQNRIFDLNSPVNRDNAFYPYYLLRQKLQDRNIQLDTYDYLGKSSDTQYKLLFFDVPREHDSFLKSHSDVEKYLVIFESEPIYGVPWDKTLHVNFKKVFTWDDSWVDNKKYFKFYWPNDIPGSIDVEIKDKTKFCIMIAGHKFVSHPLELYSERVRAIRWFERNHPEDFDLYGVGWDRYYFTGALSILNNRYLDVLRRILGRKYPSYKGTVISKREVLQKYKFSICYENIRDIPGYITEKIFDCFFAGCVPVYWGASNVTGQIPHDTFIDRRNFANYGELYNYLKGMTDERYMEYLEAIKRFVKSDRIYPFSAQCFADTLINQITSD